MLSLVSLNARHRFLVPLAYHRNAANGRRHVGRSSPSFTPVLIDE
jgi:hypothetical protein